jgi:hypothetical protein
VRGTRGYLNHVLHRAIRPSADLATRLSAIFGLTVDQAFPEVGQSLTIQDHANLTSLYADGLVTSTNHEEGHFTVLAALLAALGLVPFPHPHGSPRGTAPDVR